jgi:hypothetical protein
VGPEGAQSAGWGARVMAREGGAAVVAAVHGEGEADVTCDLCGVMCDV